MNYRGWTIQLYWFVLGYFQSIILILLVVSIPAARQALMKNPFSACLIALVILMGIKMVSMPLLHPRELLNEIPAAFTGHTPDQFLYLPALGCCLYFARSAKQKALVSFIAICIAVMTYSQVIPWWRGFNGPMRGPYLVAATLLLITVKSLPVPNVLAKVLNIIASASFIIYLSHVLLLVVWHRIVDHGHVVETPTTQAGAIIVMLSIGLVLNQMISYISARIIKLNMGRTMKAIP